MTANRTTARLWLLALLLLGTPRPAAALNVPGEHINDWYDARSRHRDGILSELELINYFFSRATAANSLPDPSGLRGVSLGPIGIGPVASATRVGDGENFLIEQRWIPVLSVSPYFTSGWATFRAMVEVDFTWGISANAVQPNQGGGFNADQVNLQTKAVYAALFPTHRERELSILIGAQPVYDNIYSPHSTPLSDIVRSGYKLSFLGTDATSLTVYGSYAGLLGKASFIPIGAAQPHKASDNDPSFAFAFLATADVAYQVQPGTVVGLSYWHLRDDTQGQAFAFEGLLRSGPGSSGLASYTGTGTMNIDRPSGTMHYLGLNFHHNLQFNTGPLAASGFVMFNVGRFDANSDKSANARVNIWGLAANLEAAYNIGKTRDDVITLEGMFANGDDNPNDAEQRGPFTLNYYGLPGAVWFNHKTLILFPFTSTVNNFTGAVTDLSNQGFGLMAAIASAAYDVVPYKLNVKLGAAFAMSHATPPDFVDAAGTALGGRGRTVGGEFNVEARYHLRYLMTVGLHAAYMVKGDFYDGNPLVKANPWATFLSFTWYAF